MKNIPVRVGWELLLFVFVVMIFSTYQEILKHNWKALTFSMIIFGLVSGLCFSIKYKLDQEFFYIKNSHAKDVKPLNDYTNLFMSEKMIGKDGILKELGLIVLPDDVRSAARTKVMNNEKLTLEALKH